jgi:hypothetical protein
MRFSLMAAPYAGLAPLLTQRSYNCTLCKQCQYTYTQPVAGITFRSLASRILLMELVTRILPYVVFLLLVEGMLAAIRVENFTTLMFEVTPER